MEKEYLSLGLGVLDLIDGNKQSVGGRRRIKEDRMEEEGKEQKAQSVWIFSPISWGKGFLPVIRMKNSFKLDVRVFVVSPLLLVLCGNICSTEEINPPGWH